MTEATKSLLKNTILGFLGGGAFSAAYSLFDDNDKSSGGEFGANEITVPLSRRNFLRSVRPERLSRDGFGKGRKPKSKSDSPAKPAKPSKPDKPGRPAKAEQPAQKVPAEEEMAGMSPKDVAALKRSLLKGASAGCRGNSRIKSYQTTVSSEIPVRNVAGAESTFRRDDKGRFASDGMPKKAWAGAGIWDDAWNTLYDNTALIGSTAIGLTVVKMVGDRIRINRKKRQVELSRKRYVDALNREVNDVDAPYYKKEAQDRSFTGQMLGWFGLAGLMSSAAGAIVMYRILEKRRQDEEKDKDKDLKRYPSEKTIRYRFPSEKELRGAVSGNSRDFFG